MDNVKIEKKWRKKWEETGILKFDRNNLENKYYVLEMFSYPSASNLHVGHWYNFGLSDSYARFKKMQGYNVFQPMGFDAFGLPSENYAIKVGKHPKDSTEENIAIMHKQLGNMGAMFEWDAEVITCEPEYYRWTQWLFLQLYKNGLAYRKEAPVNWCTSCNTVLANEQAADGVCERCGSEVIKKNLTQWFFKITQYAEELLTCLDTLDWPEKTKTMQRNWIGKSTGGEIEFRTVSGEKFRVFTTRADTLFGVSYVVLAPEHPLVEKLTAPEHKDAVNAYKEQVSKTNEIERLSSAKEKSGVFTGAYAINPISNQKIPIWIADYVLYSYGTGAVMGVPAHDERDFVFAAKYNLPVKRAIKSADGQSDGLPYVEYGVMVDSAEFNGLTSEEGKTAVVNKLNEKDMGELKVNYRLRDWLISRQRYWGAPIPIIYCDDCGIVPVPEEQLPVKLPYDVVFTPDGASPLAKNADFVNTFCPKCGKKAKREVDTMDTFVCSSWYFLRYADNRNDKQAWNKERINKMLPVDKYIGGAEHACMHLLYARFFTKAIRDMGYLDFDEPFLSLLHQGTILGTDGNKMSKSKGNTVTADDIISKYGSDVLRVYIGFAFKYTEGGKWSDDGIKSIEKWLERVERACLKANELPLNNVYGDSEAELDYVRANTIKSVTADYQDFSFNTAIARIMELINALIKYDTDSKQSNGKLYKETVLDLIRLLCPLAPNQSEELWEQLGQPYSVMNAGFPTYNEKNLVRNQVEVAVQINSKIRSRIILAAGLNEDKIKEILLKTESILQLLEGRQIKKLIIVPNRLINIIV